MFECRGYSLGIQVEPQYFQKEECGQNHQIKLLRSVNVCVHFFLHLSGSKEELTEGLCGSGWPPGGHTLSYFEQNR